VTLGDLLARAALRRPDAEAVVDGRRRLSYAELDARATAVAQGFARLGVAAGDRVLLVLRNRLEHVIAYWALQKLGGVAVPVNFRLAANELRYLLTDSGARLALFEDSTSTPVLEAASGTPTDLVFVDLHVLGLSRRSRQAGLRGTPGDPLGPSGRRGQRRAARRVRRGRAGRRQR